MYLVQAWNFAAGNFSLLRDKPHSHTEYDRRLLDLEIMQYTGLKDRLGKEIYEGDILGADGFEQTFVLEWSVERGGWSAYIDPKDTNFKVVGNIYENPELLAP